MTFKLSIEGGEGKAMGEGERKRASVPSLEDQVGRPFDGLMNQHDATYGLVTEGQAEWLQ